MTCDPRGLSGRQEGGEGGRDGREKEGERESEREREGQRGACNNQWVALQRVADAQPKLHSWCASEKEGGGIFGRNVWCKAV